MHVPPVAADVEDVHEGQRGHFFDSLIQSLLSALHCEGGAVFFPGVTDESGSKIPDVIARRLRHEDRVPAFILSNAKGSLIQAIGDLRATEVIALPEMVGNVCKGRTGSESAYSSQNRTGLHTGLQEIASAHSPSLLRFSADRSCQIPRCRLGRSVSEPASFSFW